MTKLPDGATYSHLSLLLSFFPMTSIARSLFSASASFFLLSIAQARLSHSLIFLALLCVPLGAVSFSLDRKPTLAAQSFRIAHPPTTMFFSIIIKIETVFFIEVALEK